jgi:hypothetical protein
MGKREESAPICGRSTKVGTRTSTRLTMLHGCIMDIGITVFFLRPGQKGDRTLAMDNTGGSHLRTEDDDQTISVNHMQRNTPSLMSNDQNFG